MGLEGTPTTKGGGPLTAFSQGECMEGEQVTALDG